jgi:hypothetical protein
MKLKELANFSYFKLMRGVKGVFIPLEGELLKFGGFLLSIEQNEGVRK